MPNKARVLLWDVDKAAAAIEKFITGLDVESYARNELVHTAVERKFEIIGEALSQLAKHDPVLAGRIPGLREIIAFRNLLIHGYAMVEHERVWRTAHGPLPALRAVVADIIEELGGPEPLPPRRR